MAASDVQEPVATPSNGLRVINNHEDDVFLDNEDAPQSYHHRFSSRFEVDSADLAASSSPSQVKRAIEAHLQETDRRLLDTQKLGTSLLKQREDLTTKLQEVEQHQDEAQIPDDLRRRLADIEREHNDVGREVARALIAPKQKTEESANLDPSVFTSQASSSPTKVSAPSRRQRNQPSNRTGDLQFAADISTSLLAQVRQLQAAVAERDEALRKTHGEREKLEQAVSGYMQRLRSLDESEQRYKDENWNLETRNHELQTAAEDAAEKEKRLNTSLATAVAERSRLQNDFDEIRLAHGKLSEEHTAARKVHDTEIHSLKRNADVFQSERHALQHKIDELTSQNQELAKAISTRMRAQQAEYEIDSDMVEDSKSKDADTPEHSPPPSPTKATPRHGGLESETLKSSLHHAHRMIQNLKGNIHREKTEEIELKRMLQEARDELEQRRGNDTGSASKRQKTRPDQFKKPARPEMLGNNRKARTDIELNDEDWEDNNADSPAGTRVSTHLMVAQAPEQRATDQSDAYQTANETESAFETADEKHATESEAFMTGAESLAGDSTDELTETESTAPRNERSGTVKGRSSMTSKAAGDRSSWLSTASTSGEEDDVNTPLQTAFTKFKLRNSRTPVNRQSKSTQDDTPESTRTQALAQDSPATVTGRSPPAGEQSLFAELGGLDDINSETHSTPARSSIASQQSTPSLAFTPSRSATRRLAPIVNPKPQMVDSAVMTDPWPPATTTGLMAAPEIQGKPETANAPDFRAPSPSDFPLPPSVPTSPVRKMDTSTQYTPQRGAAESPARSGTSFITPPKTVWDEIHDPVTPIRDNTMDTAREPIPSTLSYSNVHSQATVPQTPPQSKVVDVTTAPVPVLAYSSILTQATEPIVADSKDLSETLPHLETPERPRTAEKASVAAGGLLATAAAALGISRAKEAPTPKIFEDESPEIEHASRGMVDAGTSPLKEISGNARNSETSQEEISLQKSPIKFSNRDQSSQTTLTVDQIEEALMSKKAAALAPIAIPSNNAPSIVKTPTSPTRYPGRPLSRNRDALPPVPSVQRPSSASSTRPSSALSQTHPPLPSNHKDMIAQAEGHTSSPSKRESSNLKTGSVMGPPAVPASAMRRPKTPSESIRTSILDGRTSRASRNTRLEHATISSQLSRRSSVSSFASELDERFNIRPEHPSASHGFDASPGTDPRMIQAITQTMIGEFLWKYTRKTGGKEMSNTRHRRYFWVHPYTKTLYWSEQDPQTAGRNELKAKSVAIESVRVVTDDNPMPPGLHRKSLEVTTPGRKVKFTASTGQRHETWFNALSYLLLRGEDGDANLAQGTFSSNGNEITPDDVNEFRVGGYGARLVPNDRMSLSSYNSRGTRDTSVHRSSKPTRQSLPAGVVASNGSRYSQQLPPSAWPTNRTRTSSVPANADTARHSRADQPRQADTIDRDRTVRTGSVSRLSRMIGSVTGRTSRAETVSEQNTALRSDNGSIYDASLVSDNRKDSLEQAKLEKEKQDASYGGLENVRACCDGKHDVSTLAHRHASSSSNSAGHRLSNAINRSMSRRA